MTTPAANLASGVKLNTEARTLKKEEFSTELSLDQLNTLCSKVIHRDSGCSDWYGIQTQYAYKNDVYEPINFGLSTWSDVNAFITHALTQDKVGELKPRLRITLHDHLMVDTGLPSQEQLQQLQKTLTKAAYPKALEILVRGDALDAPQQILVTPDHHTATAITPEATEQNNPNDPQTILTALADEAPHLHKLFLSLDKAVVDIISDQDNSTNRVCLNEVLSRAVPYFNDILSRDEESYHVDEHKGRTKIVNFTQALARSCERLALAHGCILSPFDTLIAQTERRGPSVYAIGGGQTLTLMLLAIQAMDCGKLPLDTRLEGDNRSARDKSSGIPVNTAVAEVVEQNQRRTNLGKNLSIAQKNQCLIHMRPDTQRLERLRLHPPSWLLFNVPTNALTQVLTPQMMTALSTMPSAPILVLSAKSFSEIGGKVDVPATALYQALAATPNKLQNKLIVLGGYFAAPWLATGSPVHFVVAGKDPEAVDSFANLIPDDRSGSIEHDRRYGKDQLFGTAIMGALKNQAVYTFARKVVQKTYEQLHQFPEWTVYQHCSKINAWASSSADHAIEQAEKAVEQLTDRGTTKPINNDDVKDRYDNGALGLRTITDFRCAQGVRADFERCMIRPVEAPFVRFVAGLQEIERLPLGEQGQKLSELLTREVVDSGKGFGSRNSRDGVIDQALYIIFNAQSSKGESASANFKDFRAQWTPPSWLAKTTEGRNGMLPVLTHLTEHHREIPDLIQEAAELYGQLDERLLDQLPQNPAVRQIL
jgi:hypothetical protein